MNTSMADGAAQRLVAQIGDALFGQPGLTLMELAEKVKESQPTPSSRWAANGEPDPHGSRYDCERAALVMGDLSDDELANAVFLHGNEQPSVAQIVAGAMLPIAYLTAAKDRIRWLSRALVAAEAKSAAQPSPAGQAVRAQFEAWAHAQSYRGGNIITDRDADHPDAYACPNAQLTWQCWKAALAARQPVEFERAVPTRRRESAVELLLSLGFVWNNQRWEDRRQPVRQARNPLLAYADSYRLMAELSVDGRVSATSVAYDIETNMAPHAAPPAQAVDLGQFRECVELMEWQEREHANPDFPRGDAKKHAEALRLLALIDSKAVGNG